MARENRFIVATLFAALCSAGVITPASAAQDRAKLDRALQARAERSSTDAGTTRVIVRLRDGVENGADVVRRVGGRAGARLLAVNAQVGDVADTALDALTADPAVLSVHLDRPLVSHRKELSLASSAVAPGLTRASGGWDGSGVGVAMIDSGVVPHHDIGLAGANNSRPRLAGFIDFVNGDKCS